MLPVWKQTCPGVLFGNLPSPGGVACKLLWRIGPFVITTAVNFQGWTYLGIGHEANQKAHNSGYRLLQHTIHEGFGLVPALDLLVPLCLNSSTSIMQGCLIIITPGGCAKEI
jgi:hypothetical protein